jgi:hypothetical protein
MIYTLLQYLGSFNTSYIIFPKKLKIENPFFFKNYKILWKKKYWIFKKNISFVQMKIDFKID